MGVTRYRTIVADQMPPLASDLAVGIAGEHLVVADLLLAGYRAIMAEQHCPYDIVVDVGDRLARIQVKSARKASAETRRSGGRYTPAYKWSTRRSGKRGLRQYSIDGFDILALVALDIRRVAYLPWTGQQYIQLPAPDTDALPAGNGAVRPRRRNFDDLAFWSACL